MYGNTRFAHKRTAYAQGLRWKLTELKYEIRAHRALLRSATKNSPNADFAKHRIARSLEEFRQTRNALRVVFARARTEFPEA